jgi:hypothetical protein
MYSTCCTRSKFLILTHDGARARFHNPTHGKVQEVEGGYVADQQNFNHILNQRVSRAMRNIHVDIHENAKFAKMTAVLGFLSNNNPLPDMQYDIETKQCSFDWKAFLNSFYTSYMLDEKLKLPSSPYASIAARNEVMEGQFARQWSLRVLWHKTYRRHEDLLFAHAYLVRLK